MSKFDPRTHVVRERRSWAPPTALEFRALAVELRPLRALAGWQPVAARLEELAAALGGETGLTARELGTLRRWAAAWAKLPPQLRALYAEHAPSNASASRLLLYVLDGRPHPLGPDRGEIRRLYLDHHGHEAPWPLVPTPQHPRRRP